MFTKEAIKLAKPTVMAIKKIAERQEKKCPECGGEGWVGRKTLEQSVPSTCPKCNGTRNVKGKWEWEPEVGERYQLGDYIHLIKDDSDIDYIHSLPPPNVVIPLLHWERIREIMLSLDFKLYFRNPWEGATVAFAKLKELECDKDIIEEMYRDEHIPSNRWHHASSFQPAVMQAVIELEKEEKDGL